jgi:chemotaxis protein CheZ
MKMEDIANMKPADVLAVSPEVFQQLGSITRLLHDTMQQLGVMPKLQIATDGLPDARSRLSYIATKTAEAANKVLNTVDQAKNEHHQITAATRAMAALIVADPVKAVASGAVMNFVHEVEASTKRIDDHLTDIMMAQDFHDLTGQVVAKVVTLANDLEDSLVKLLIQVVPEGVREQVDPSVLNGPVVNPAGRTDVVSDQGEVAGMSVVAGRACGAGSLRFAKQPSAAGKPDCTKTYSPTSPLRIA